MAQVRRLVPVMMVALVLGGCVAEAEPEPPEAFNGTDIAWIQLMIPMNEQMLPLLEQAVASSALAEVRAVAAEVHIGYSAEIEALKGLRLRAGIGAENPHRGHDMPGLVTDADLGAARGLAGGAFDEFLAGCAREQVGQRELLARGALSSGTHAGVKSLAHDILTSAQREGNIWESALHGLWVYPSTPAKEI